MKSRFTPLCIVLLLMLSSFTVPVQDAGISTVSEGTFDFFRAHREGRTGVGLSWASSSTNVIEFRIERSYDGEFFDQIDYMPDNGQGTYKYMDNSVFPGVIYYRIIAVLADGSTETSVVKSVRVVRRG